MSQRFLILGSGYTGSRVAKLLAQQGHEVWCTSRHHAFQSTAQLGTSAIHHVQFDSEQPGSYAALSAIPEGPWTVLHSIPTLHPDRSSSASGSAENKPREREITPQLLAALRGRIARIVYLSTTGVYGNQHEVDEHTQPAPITERTRLRLEAEHAVLNAVESALVLRPAAIYGPGRGVHVAMREGRFQLMGDGSNSVSRIHVADLAAITAAALTSTLTGAWPVADEDPATSRDVAQNCADLLGLPLPASVSADQLSETRRADRRVNGTAILRHLGIALRYRSYREGIPAALSEELKPQ